MNRDDRDPTLRSLRELDGYEVADDDPNPLGWAVATADGQQVGEVKDLVVDTTTMKVQYFDVALDDAVFDLGTSGQVLIPAQTARLSMGDRRVIVPSNSPDELFQYIGTQGAGIASWHTTAGDANPTAYAHDLPAATLDTPTAAVDDTAPLGSGSAAPLAGQESARVTRSAEELRIGKRRVQVGEVVVHKTVETEQVHEPVTREVERVLVERREGAGDARTTPHRDRQGR
jgi:sporulation protein YlmC with PRC-barrel domain